MTSRIITSGQGKKVGLVAHSSDSRSKQEPIRDLHVYSNYNGLGYPKMIAIEAVSTLNKKPLKPVIALTHNAAVEVIKGLLENLDPVLLSADDELMQVIKNFQGQAEVQVQGVLNAIQRTVAPAESSGGESPIPPLPNAQAEYLESMKEAEGTAQKVAAPSFEVMPEEQRPPHETYADTYYKDDGKRPLTRTYISGRPLPRVHHGVIYNSTFKNCEFHPMVAAVNFVNCRFVNCMCVPMSALAEGCGNTVDEQSTMGDS